jgi:hypothetical protein
MSTRRPRCGSWLTLALALSAGCGDGGGGRADKGDGAASEGGADTAAVGCAAQPLDCDGQDNDCDGVIDEGGEREARQLWGVDADADGYPASTPRLDCAGVEGETAIALLEAAVDCNDLRFAINPGAVESCLGVDDEDCNGLESCADPACAGRACAEVCDDGVDNDDDGRTDCRDSLCWGAGCAEDCASPLCQSAEYDEGEVSTLPSTGHGPCRAHAPPATDRRPGDHRAPPTRRPSSGRAAAAARRAPRPRAYGGGRHRPASRTTHHRSGLHKRHPPHPPDSEWSRRSTPSPLQHPSRHECVADKR